MQNSIEAYQQLKEDVNKDMLESIEKRVTEFRARTGLFMNSVNFSISFENSISEIEENHSSDVNTKVSIS